MRKFNPFLMSFFRFIFALILLLGISYKGYSQQYTFKSTSFSIIDNSQIYYDVNYLEFNNDIVALYNENSKVKTIFRVYKSQTTKDVETNADLVIMDTWDEKNKEDVRIILALLNNECFVILDKIVFYDLQLIDS